MWFRQFARKIGPSQVGGTDESDAIDEAETLLSQQYHYVCPAAIVVYLVLQVLISMVSGLGEQTTDFAVGTRVYYFYYSAATSFAVSAAQQIVKIFECRLQEGKHRSSEAIYCAVLTVNLIAGSSFLITFLNEFGGICTDVFGVPSTTPQWAEWIVTVPLMVYMTLALEEKEALTLRDKVILAVFVCAIGFGFLLNFKSMGVPMGIVLFVLGCCSITVNFWLDRVYGSKLFDEMGAELTGKGADYALMARLSKQRTLSRLFLTVFPFFPATHLAGQIQLLSREQVFIAYGLCSLIAKLLFAGSVSDAHVGLITGIQALKLSTEKAMNTTRREFLRYVFHEVRVPLNTITMGLIVLKEDEEKLGDASKEALEMMGMATNFMGDTLNDCLSMQKIEDSKMQIVPKPFTMGALIKGATLAIRGNADAKGITIAVESALDMNVDHGSIIHNNNNADGNGNAKDKFFVGDLFRLEHVLMNFLSNAIKFSPEGSEVKIVVSGKDRKTSLKPSKEGRGRKTSSMPMSSNGIMSKLPNSKSGAAKDGEIDNSAAEELICDVKVLVKDRGVGISKADQAHLFQPYNQVNADALQGGRGSGLGLFLAKEIVALHGGTVIVESEEGHGSAFGFSIPFPVIVSTSAATPNQEVSVHHDDGGSAIAGETKSQAAAPRRQVPTNSTFLLVDDSLSNRKLLSMILRNYGAHCEFAADGMEAVEKMQSMGVDKFSLVFMDQMMPKMDGKVCVARLRAMGYNNLVIGLTGAALDEDKRKFMEAGADCVFPKPLRQVQIDAILDHTRKYGFKSQVGKKFVVQGSGSAMHLSSLNMVRPADPVTAK